MKNPNACRLVVALMLAVASFPVWASGLGALDKKLYTAALNQDVAAVNTLLSQGAKPTPKDAGREMTPFQGAIYVKNAAIVQAMIKAGADVNDPDPFGNGGQTFLMFAIQWGDENLEVVKALIAAKADVNAVRKSTGQTPLSDAIQQNAPAVVAVLKAAGAKSRT
ncbi:ankyrin repeat protein [Luteibacter rhizovicinus]|uniref:Ankyrin repeat protein n=1 Tax=Luteibacter rhizovicinus TaxID=242606 RepID=A0A4R3YY76_9GAMM|nr:ankyrin repeat domain-containing protein [Luteibacter rhizovicinus]TCV96444.1 ankyrin repeat protein [Luteibacter rhizovicinus]